MIFKIAWRNIWRNRLRSSVLLTSIALGVWAGVFIIALSWGMTNQRRDNLIRTTLSHIQIHHPDYSKYFRLTDTIDAGAALRTSLEGDPQVLAHASRLILNGMASNSRGGSGVRIMGVDPEAEKKISVLYERVTSGEWFQNPKNNRILIGEKLAHKLKIKLMGKIVLTFQSPSREILAGAFRVEGIFKTGNTQWDERHVFVRSSDLERLLGQPWGDTEIALLAQNFDSIPNLTAALRESFPHEKIEPWTEVSPEMGYTEAVMEQYLYIIMGIILLAMAFGILNTMLMAVLERRHELAMILAVGMNKSKVFTMILAETVMLCLFGGTLGILLGWSSITYWGKKGIDLSLLKEGLENWGIQTVMYPELGAAHYRNIFIMILCTALLAALYPAWKALKLNPAEGIRQL